MFIKKTTPNQRHLKQYLKVPHIKLVKNEQTIFNLWRFNNSGLFQIISLSHTHTQFLSFTLSRRFIMKDYLQSVVK